MLVYHDNIRTTSSADVLKTEENVRKKSLILYRIDTIFHRNITQALTFLCYD